MQKNDYFMCVSKRLPESIGKYLQDNTNGNASGLSTLPQDDVMMEFDCRQQQQQNHLLGSYLLQKKIDYWLYCCHPTCLGVTSLSYR